MIQSAEAEQKESRTHHGGVAVLDAVVDESRRDRLLCPVLGLHLRPDRNRSHAMLGVNVIVCTSLYGKDCDRYIRTLHI